MVSLVDMRYVLWIKCKDKATRKVRREIRAIIIMCGRRKVREN